VWYTLIQNYSYSLPILVRYRRYFSFIKFSLTHLYSLWLFNSLYYSKQSLSFLSYVYKLFLKTFLNKNLWKFFTTIVFRNQGLLTNNLTQSYTCLSLINLNYHVKTSKLNHVFTKHFTLNYLSYISIFKLPLLRKFFYKKSYFLLHLLLVWFLPYCKVFNIYTNFVKISNLFFIFYYFNIFFFKIHNF